MNGFSETKTLLIKLRGVLMFGILILSILLLLENLVIRTAPTNQNFSIPSQLEPEEIVSGELGGNDYYEFTYDKNLDGRKWLVPCHSAIEVDDAEDVCRGFAKGYLRKYSAYKLLSGTIMEGRYRINLETLVSTADGNWATIKYENEKLNGDYSLLLNVLEYDSPDDAKSACSFLVTDASFDTIKINSTNVLSKESEEDNWAYYVLPTDKIVISIQGSRAAAREAMSAIIEEYRK